MSVIARVEVGRFDYEFRGSFKFFKPDPDGKTRRQSVLVRLTDTDGVQGWGQAVPIPTWTYETVESAQTTLSGYLAQAVLGVDPADLEEIHRRMDQAIKPAFSVGQPLCKAAVDLACYDLFGKRSGKSVAELLGGPRRQALKLNWTINSPDMTVVEQQLEEGKARGYDNYTVKVGPPQSPEYDLQLVRAVRRFAPESFLWTDANTGYSLESALEIIPRLADAGVDVLESPLPPAYIRGYQALKRLGALPILMDEGIVSPLEVAEFIALDMVDGITMKPARCAGLWPSQKIIRLLWEHDLMVLGSGLTDPDLSLAAAVHLYAWAGLERPCALNGPQFLAESLIVGDFLPRGDAIRLPDAPGLGVSLDRRAQDPLEVVASL